jgi:hypothetical protein
MTLEDGARRGGRAALFVALALFLMLAWGAAVRIHTTLADPNFDARDGRGLLRSDPALLSYLTAEIGAAMGEGRLIPRDFRADPRLQHPFVTDVPREFPVGPEFLVAACDQLQRALLAEPLPLHAVALVVLSAVGATFVLGVYAGVRALTGSRAWAMVAAGLALVTPANYRTIGFLWVGEDASLPFFALHLGFLARTRASGRVLDACLSGLCAALALATWHAASFVLTLELGAWFLVLLARGASPLGAPRMGLVLVAPVLAGLLVPVLRATGLLVSPLAALVLALVAPVLVQRLRPLGPWGVRGLSAGVLGLGLLASHVLAGDAYRHVHEVVWAKLRFLGRLPEDPEVLSFDARLLWQGPFETLPLDGLGAWCGWPLALAALLAVAVGLRRVETAGPFVPLLALAGVCLAASWMFARLVVLLGMLVPPLVVLVLSGVERRRWAIALAAGLLLAQAAAFARFVGAHRIDWYLPPRARDELVRLIEFVAEHVPPAEPIVGDFVNSTALLAHTRRPIVLQPKYETDRSRREAEAFWTTFFQGTSADLARLCDQRFHSRYLLVDRFVLWDVSRALGGVPAHATAPRPGTAAAEFLADDDAALRAIPGFELLYRSPAGISAADYRLFRRRE